jgi:hypothetical protein
MTLTVTVPEYWAIVGLITVTELADVIYTEPDGVFGIMSEVMGFTETGAFTQWQNDSINGGYYNSPCLDCVTPLSGFYLVDYPPFDPVSTLILTTRTYDAGGLASIDRLAIGGFDAISPEPSAFVLLATAVIALGCWRRWGTTASTTRTMACRRARRPGRRLRPRSSP